MIVAKAERRRVTDVIKSNKGAAGVRSGTQWAMAISESGKKWRGRGVKGGKERP